MRSVRLNGVEHDWHATAMVAAGLSLGVVGGFFGSLLKERGSLAAARESVTSLSPNEVAATTTTHRVVAAVAATAGQAGRQAEMRA